MHFLKQVNRVSPPVSVDFQLKDNNANTDSLLPFCVKI